MWLRVLAVSGFLLTLLFVILSVFPIIPVVSASAFTEKTIIVLVLANIGGVLLYRLRPQRDGVLGRSGAAIEPPPSCP
jgi:hypothetical protein